MAENTEQDIQVEQDTSADASTEADVAEARKWGWRPQAEWKGPKEKWMDAKAFNDYAKDNVGILRDKLLTTEGKLSNLQRDYGELLKDSKQVKEIGYKLASAEWQEKYDALKSELVTAKQDGDAVKEVEVQEALATHKDAKPSKPQEKQQANQGDGQMPPEYREWFDRNSWYNDDKLKIRANAIGVDLVQQAAARGEALSGVPLFEAVKAHMEEIWPEAMGIQHGGVQQTHRSGRRANSGDNGTVGAKTYENMPEESRKQCDRYVAKGMLTKEDYVKQYYLESSNG